MCVRADSTDVQADILPKALDDITEIHAIADDDQYAPRTTQRTYIPQRLEHEAKMAAMLEGSIEPNDMFLILRVGLLQLVEDLDILEAGLEP